MTESEIEMVENPVTWPHRPMLPMKLYLESGVALGYLLEKSGLTIHDYDTRAPVQTFETVEEMRDFGWRID